MTNLRRGAVVFHRHGHRAPARAIVPVVRHDDEIKLWKSLTKAEEIHGEICRRFPILNDNNSTPNDIKTAPFGLITQKGLLSLEQLGKNIARRFPHLTTTTKLQVFATNYQRTQASAQQLLTGLFDDQTQVDQTSVIVRPSNADPMSFYEGVVPTTSDPLPASCVTVYHPNSVTLTISFSSSSSFLLGNPALSKHLIQLSQTAPDFVEREESDEIRRLRDTLLNVLPGLPVHTTNKFDWMAAFDYYICRESHNIPIDPQIASHSEAVKRHLSYRFGHYCTNKHHLAHICVPLLKDLRSALMTILTKDAPPHEVSLTIFSGHDISILALLYCFQAHMVTSSKSTSSFWPKYGSSLLFDVRQSSSLSTPSTSALIDVYYDLEPLSITLPGTIYTPTISSPNNTFDNKNNIVSFTLDDLTNCIDYMSRDLIII